MDGILRPEDILLKSTNMEKIKQNTTSDEILSLIFGYIEIISKETDLDNILNLLADMGKKLVHADRISVWMLDRENNQLITRAAHGVDVLKIPEGSGLVGYAIENNQEIILHDPYSDPRFNKNMDKETGYVTKEMLVIPFENSVGEVIGAYQALNKLTGDMRFTEWDLSCIRLAASYAGKSIETALLNKEIEKTQREVIFMLGEVSEYRSSETGHHVNRVAEYASIIARGMNLSDTDIKLIELAAPMHDIGKIGIPDSILLKPGKFSVQEFEIMKSHTTIGFNILKNSERTILKSAAVIAHEHHERFDGKGYPIQLAGEDIHIYARIIAICDVFDALVSERVYKKAWSLDDAFWLLREENGKQFDPAVVKAFFDGIEEIRKIRDKYVDC